MITQNFKELVNNDYHSHTHVAVCNKNVNKIILYYEKIGGYRINGLEVNSHIYN